MKRATVAMLTLLALPALADEGMWQPHQLPGMDAELRGLGMRIDPEKLADLTAHPMNAVISLGGCTASFVSPEGLVVTNHHCAFGALQYNSTEDANLLKDGFLAQEHGEELFAGPGSRVLVTTEVSDVTDEILGSLGDVEGRARYQAIEDRWKALVAACEEDEGHRCRVASFHGGLEYYLTKQLEILDVRLVYAPAGSVGKYGGDIDNWMWPRHTGDFSFYRAYVGPDGQPAVHDEKNVPFQPKHWLRVSADGLEDGDFVMVAGYPGSTNRYRLGEEVASTIDWVYPTRKQLFHEWLDIIERETTDRPDAAIKYASLVAGLNNAAKNYQGMLDGFAKSDILDRKRQQAAELQGWIEQGGEMRQQYLSAVEELRELVDRNLAHRERGLYYEFLARRSSLLRAATTLYRLALESEKPDAEREPGYQERDLLRIEERLSRIDRSYEEQVDRAIWAHFIARYSAIDEAQHVGAFDAYFGIKDGGVDVAKLGKKLDRFYAKTELADAEARLAWMDRKPEEFEKTSDPFLQLAVKLMPSDLKIEEEDKEIAGRFQELRPRYMAALIAYLESQGKAIYPDANGTLRVTYGTVKGYAPKDAVSYTPFTTVQGIVEKDTGEAPFDSPQTLLDAIEERRFGGFIDQELGSVPVNFLSTVDTTGGNSGSPTLNGDAELVGLLFDGNYEAINADWDYNERITRSIHVDIRYTLWIMDEIDGAQRLLREMGIDPVQAANRQ